MQTRGKSGIFKPKVYFANKEPMTIHDALLREHWKSAMRDELLALPGTLDSCLVMQANSKSLMKLEGFYDADWALTLITEDPLPGSVSTWAQI